MDCVFVVMIDMENKYVKAIMKTHLANFCYKEKPFAPNLIGQNNVCVLSHFSCVQLFVTLW